MKTMQTINAQTMRFRTVTIIGLLCIGALGGVPFDNLCAEWNMDDESGYANGKIFILG